MRAEIFACFIQQCPEQWLGHCGYWIDTSWINELEGRRPRPNLDSSSTYWQAWVVYSPIQASVSASLKWIHINKMGEDVCLWGHSDSDKTVVLRKGWTGLFTVAERGLCCPLVTGPTLQQYKWVLDFLKLLILPISVRIGELAGQWPRRRQWQPTLVFLPGEPQGRRSLVGCRLYGCAESTRLKWLGSSRRAPLTPEPSFLLSRVQRPLLTPVPQQSLPLHLLVPLWCLSCQLLFTSPRPWVMGWTVSLKIHMLKY